MKKEALYSNIEKVKNTKGIKRYENDQNEKVQIDFNSFKGNSLKDNRFHV